MPVLSKPARQPEGGQHTVEYFSNANYPVIYGGNFTTVSHLTTRPVREELDGFQILLRHVSSAAFHNSKQRVDPPRCHAHTREAVMEELFDWITGNVPREAWIAWLNGAAGAGKSAICQSMAEMCIKRGVKVASFFFFRTDISRNTIDPVIATLAYQIIRLFPETKELISQSVKSHPLIFEQTFETQLEVLIVAPIRQLQISETVLLMIDGVDECMDKNIQTNLIRTFSKLLCHKDLSVIVLFASRREGHIQMAFNADDMDNILKQIPLDNNYKAEADIQRFLVNCFDDIKRSHPMRNRLKVNWPATEDVQQIIDKSSGQFVFASTVIKFVSMPSSSPSAQLEIVRGLRPAGRSTPFAELDALYRHIFSQVEDITHALRILTLRLHCEYHGLKYLSYFLNITEEDVETILAALTSVLSCDADTDKIVFHHASLPDFLWDKRRSHEYCISGIATDLTILWFKNTASDRFSSYHQHVSDANIANLINLLSRAKADPNLRKVMLEYTPLQTPWVYSSHHHNWARIFLDAVKKMDLGDDGHVYRILSRRIIRFMRKKHPEFLYQVDIHSTTWTKRNFQFLRWPQPGWIRRVLTIPSRLKTRDRS